MANDDRRPGKPQLEVKDEVKEVAKISSAVLAFARHKKRDDGDSEVEETPKMKFREDVKGWYPTAVKAEDSEE